MNRDSNYLGGMLPIACACLLWGCPDPTIPSSSASVLGSINSDGTSYDAGVATAIPSSPSSIVFVAAVTTPPGDWQLTVTAQGSLALPAASGADAGTVGVYEFTSDQAAAMSTNTFDVPLAIVGQGPATVLTTVGTATQEFGFTVAAPVMPAFAGGPVTFVEHDGLSAVNKVVICSSSDAGTVAVSIAGSEGVLASATSPILAVSPEALDGGDGGCNVFPGEADFYWTGYEPQTTWEVSLDGGQAQSLRFDMLGTEVCVGQTLAQNDWYPDGGPADAGTPASVELLISRNAFDGGCDDAGGPLSPTEPVAHAAVVFALPVGATAPPQATTTDSNGAVFFNFTAPPGATTVQLGYTVGGVASGTVSVAQPMPSSRSPNH